MKRIALLLPLLLLAFATFAAADTVPVFNLTAGSVVVTIKPVFGGVDQIWSFGNSGISISGGSYYGYNQQCLGWAPGGSSCDPSFAIMNSGLPTPNMGTVSGSNSIIFFGGPGVSVSGASFIPPTGTGLTTFSVTMPVLFSGSFNACVAGGGGVNAGCYDYGTGVINPVFGIFNVSGTGLANLHFTNLEVPGTTIWRLSSGTYTLNSVPEPGSIMLLGTGVVGLIVKLRRKLRP